jgi:hypothetical protein
VPVYAHIYCDLKYYNNDLSLYEKNVKLRDFSSPTIRGRTFNVLDTLGSSNEIKSVINLVFQDESTLYVGNDFNINNEPNAVYTNDIIELRTKVASLSKSYYTSIIFRIDTKTKKSTDFKNLLTNHGLNQKDLEELREQARMIDDTKSPVKVVVSVVIFSMVVLCPAQLLGAGNDRVLLPPEVSTR